MPRGGRHAGEKPATSGGIAFEERYQQFWKPMRLGSFAANRRSHVFGVVARLKSGADLRRAQVSMDTVAARLASTPYRR